MILKSFSFTCGELRERFPDRILDLVGDPNRRVSLVDAPSTQNPDALAFCATPASLREGFASKAAALVVPLEAREAGREFPGVLLLGPKPDVFMASFLNEFVLASPYRGDVSGVHPTATIHPEAQVASTASIGAGARIGPGAVIGERVCIGANSVVEAAASIGEESVIHPLVYVGHSCVVGRRCELYPHVTIGKEGFGYATDENGVHHKIPHLGRVVLEDDVHIGGNSTIDRGTFGDTRIGRGAILDNQIHMAHNCKIGGGSVVTACFAMAGSSEVGRYFVSGGRANVTGHVKVGDHVRVAALSAISKDIAKPGEYGGVPLVPLREHLRIKAATAQLPELRKQLARLTKKVFGDNASDPSVET